MKRVEAIFLSLLVVGCVIFGRYTRPPRVEEVTHEVVRLDTLVVHHTTPHIVTQRVVDTLLLRDTVALPVVQRCYSDSGYSAWVSGYEPRLDSIHLYQEQELRYLPLPYALPPKRWALSLQVGYGVGQGGVSPYLGIGISYQLWAW